MKQQIPKTQISLHQQHSEDRQRFQVERMILFTDAVFAIAITLLILEIKIPTLSYEGLTSAKIAESVFGFPNIMMWVGFFISFWVIALYWIDHHRTFIYVDNYDGKLVFLNLLFLMSIGIMPFTSALYSKYFGYDFSTQLYCYNVAFTGFVKLWMWYYISNPENKISYFPIDHIKKKYHTIRSWIAPSVFIFTGLITPYFQWSRVFFLGIFVIQLAVGIYFERKYGLKERFK
jgi:uncharacterized membrane protein